MPLIGCFNGVDSERAIAWRVSDSMSGPVFLELAPEEMPQDYSTLSQVR